MIEELARSRVPRSGLKSVILKDSLPTEDAASGCKPCGGSKFERSQTASEPSAPFSVRNGRGRPSADCSDVIRSLRGARIVSFEVFLMTVERVTMWFMG